MKVSAFLLAMVLTLPSAAQDKSTLSDAKEATGDSEFKRLSDLASISMSSLEGMRVSNEVMTQSRSALVAASKRCFEKKENATSYAFVANVTSDGHFTSVHILPSNARTACIAKSIELFQVSTALPMAYKDGFPIRVNMNFGK